MTIRTLGRGRAFTTLGLLGAAAGRILARPAGQQSAPSPDLQLVKPPVA